MLSKALFKQTLRENGKILLLFMAVLAMYGMVIVGMFDPKFGENMSALMSAFPADMMKAFGFDMNAATLTGFLSSYLYGMLLLMFPMLYEIIVANRLVARQVDKGSMAYLLASPNTRVKIILTQCTYMIGSIAVLILFFTGLLAAVCHFSFPGELDLAAFLRINLGVFLLHLALSGICFLASCCANDSRMSLAFGAGIPFGFFLLQMLANMGGKLENIKYCTIFTLYRTNDLLSNAAGAYWPLLALFAIGAGCYAAGVLIFSRRNLSL